jgi:hypothetical protein
MPASRALKSASIVNHEGSTKRGVEVGLSARQSFADAMKGGEVLNLHWSRHVCEFWGGNSEVSRMRIGMRTLGRVLKALETL